MWIFGHSFMLIRSFSIDPGTIRINRFWPFGKSVFRWGDIYDLTEYFTYTAGIFILFVVFNLFNRDIYNNAKD